MSNRNLLIILGAVLIALAVVVVAVALTIGSASEPEQAAPVIPEAREETQEETEARIQQQLEMVVFFQSPRRADLLVPAKRSVFNTISIGQQADQLIQKLIQGPAPAEGLLPTVPDGTQLQRLYIAEDGTAYIAFNAALARNHRGGAAGEMMTVYSIVNTLCVNFPSIRRVQILVEGIRSTTLAGHIDISRPLPIDTDLFASPQPSAPAQSEAEAETGQDLPGGI